MDINNNDRIFIDGEEAEVVNFIYDIDMEVAIAAEKSIFAVLDRINEINSESYPYEVSDTEKVILTRVFLEKIYGMVYPKEINDGVLFSLFNKIGVSLFEKGLNFNFKSENGITIEGNKIKGDEKQIRFNMKSNSLSCEIKQNNDICRYVVENNMSILFKEKVNDEIMYGEVLYDKDGFIISKSFDENGKKYEYVDGMVVAHAPDIMMFDGIFSNYMESDEKELNWARSFPVPSSDKYTIASDYQDLRFKKNLSFAKWFPSLYAKACKKIDGIVSGKGDAPPGVDSRSRS